ncbi:MAG: sulfotransferase-like domain-containing protein [Paracoccaceae bacterium]
MKIHALWCHPRSVSTAFERIIRARGDLAVLHEPFMYHFYLAQKERLFPDFEPEAGHPQTYGEIREMILAKSNETPLFFKDMAYYVVKDLPDDDTFVQAMSHAFLIRDPAEAILSYQKKDPGFTQNEMGIEAQYRLYHALKECGLEPLVVTADQLRQAPEVTLKRYWDHVGLSFAPHAFSWDSAVPEGWESVAAWHDEVLSRGAIERPDDGRDIPAELAALGTPYTDYDQHHRPFYQMLCKVADEQLHQK